MVLIHALHTFFSYAFASGHLEIKRRNQLWAFRVSGVNLVGEDFFGVGEGDGEIQTGLQLARDSPF